MSKKEKREQRRKEDRVFNVFMWACVAVLMGSAVGVWYLIIQLANSLNEITGQALTLMR